MKTMVSKTFLKVMGILGYLLFCIFAGMSAGIALCAFISMLSSNFIIGLFGTAGAALLSWMFWSIRKELLS